MIGAVKRSRAWWVVLAGLTCGAIVWGASPLLTGMREPFDSDTLYYPVAIFFSGVVASLPGPRYWWLSVPAVFLGEHLYALIAYPDLRPWFVFGIVINFIIPTWWPAAVGALLVFITYRLLTWHSSGTPRERGAP